MFSESTRVANTREHISWSHRFGAYALADISDISGSSRTLLFVMLSAIVVASAIWHAAGLTLARLENVILPRMKAPLTHD